MPCLPVRHSNCRRARIQKLLLSIGFVCLLPLTNYGQSGSASTGTGGSHIIQGHIYFPSGRRVEGSIQVKLQSYSAGEISAMTDSSGSFTFTALSPGNYTVVIDAGVDYEIAKEGVFIDTDVNMSALGLPAITTSRRYTVMITLQLKHSVNDHTKGSVINAALAEVPADARALYEQGLEQARAGEALKAIDKLRAAISLYPSFPLALNELGVQYLRINLPNKAVEPLRSATRLSPDAFAPMLNLGIALLEAGQFSEAEAKLRDAVKRNDSAPTAHMYLGVALTKLRNYVDAEKELRRAIDLAGTQLGLAHYYLGGIYWGRGEYGHAADELETYLRLTPNAQDAERIRGTIKELRAKS